MDTGSRELDLSSTNSSILFNGRERDCSPDGDFFGSVHQLPYFLEMGGTGRLTGAGPSLEPGQKPVRIFLPPVSMTSDSRQQMPLEAILLREPVTSTFPQPRSLRLQHSLPRFRVELAPLTVIFSDQSTNSPTSWKWEYKKTDGSSDRVSEPGPGIRTNIFAAGIYDIRLTATNAAGSDTFPENRLHQRFRSPGRSGCSIYCHSPDGN